MRSARSIVLAALTLALLVPAAATAAVPKVPAGWAGVTVSASDLLDSDALWPSETAVMRGAGVQTVRVPFYWSSMQPWKDWASTPPGVGVVDDGSARPTLFGGTDRIVEGAARAGITVLPTVLGAPGWDARFPGAGRQGFSPPAQVGPYAEFMTALVGRYGPKGTFWAEHPDLTRRPIGMWQVWNEPNLCYYWNAVPSGDCSKKNPSFARSYVALVRAARGAVRKADPKAKIMLAGLPNQSWIALAQIYKAKGRGTFDAVAIHGYTESKYLLKLLELSRTAMRKAGDAKLPIYVTEFGYSSGGKRVAHSKSITWNTTEAGQAKQVTTLFGALATSRKRLGIAGAYWYSWYTPENPGGTSWEDYTGLRRRATDGTSIVGKPSFTAFQRVMKTLQH